MKNLKQILGQDRAVAQLKGDLLSEKVKHAYLFIGPLGIGKKTAAVAFAKALFCQEPEPGGESCGVCRFCRLVDKNQFADFHQIEGRPNEPIKIEHVREIQKQLGLKSVEGTQRVIFLDKIDYMTPESANCLLKSLEEPPEATVFILAADSEKGIFETILSRCQIVRFLPLEETIIREILQTEYNLDENEAALLASLGTGSVGDILGKKEQLFEIRPWLDPEPVIDKLADRSSLFQIAGQLENMKCLDELLDYWVFSFRRALLADIIPEKYDASAGLPAGKKQTFLLDSINYLQETKGKIRSRVNTRLALDILLQKMADSLDERQGDRHVRTK